MSQSPQGSFRVTDWHALATHLAMDPALTIAFCPHRLEVVPLLLHLLVGLFPPQVNSRGSCQSQGSPPAQKCPSFGQWMGGCPPHRGLGGSSSGLLLSCLKLGSPQAQRRCQTGFPSPAPWPHSPAFSVTCHPPALQCPGCCYGSHQGRPFSHIFLQRGKHHLFHELAGCLCLLFLPAQG